MPFDAIAIVLAGALGLMIGSFLNVVIHRLPLMLEAQWSHEEVGDSGHPLHHYNLALPASHCPQCLNPLRWIDNIPLLSYLWLLGRCRHCQTRISWRYPVVEFITGALFVVCVSLHGISAEAIVWAFFASALLVLAFIDAETTLLPDAITQPLVWTGLLMANLGLTEVNLADALWGAVMGYLFLSLSNWLFGKVTGKQGMGQGDFKLLAAMGAWLGWPALVTLVLISSLGAVGGGLISKIRGRAQEDVYIPFGPYLAFAGLWVMTWGALPLITF